MEYPLINLFHNKIITMYTSRIVSGSCFIIYDVN